MSTRHTVQGWRERIEVAREYREKFGRSKEWQRWWEYYRNEYGDRTNYLSVNMIFAIVRSLVPRLYFRNPRVTITPLRPGLYLQARVLERVDNLMIAQIGVKKALKAAAQDAFLYGTGIIKRGYDSEFGFDPDQAYEEQGKAVTDSGETRRGEKIEYDNTIRAGWPWVKRIHPATFYVPWGCSDLESAPWCAHEIIRPVEDVKADPKYSRAATRDLKGTLTYLPTAVDRHPGSSVRHRLGKTGEYVRLWEIYDAKTGKIIVIADGHDKILREDDDPFASTGFPFHPVVFNPDPDHFWGISDCVNLEPLQLELNEQRTQLRAHRRIALLKFLYKDGMIDENELQKLLWGDIDAVGIGIKVNGEPSQAIMTLQPHIPADLVMATNETRMDMREITGFSRNQLGEYDKSTRRTATEAAIVEQAASIRVDERRDVLADVLVDIVKAINETIFDYWTEEHIAQIVGPDGASYWVTFTGDELRGEYAYRIDPDNVLPQTSEKRKQEAIEVYSALKDEQVIGPDGQPRPMFNKEYLGRHLLSQYEGIDLDLALHPGWVPPQAGGGPIPIGQLAFMLAQAQQGGETVAALPGSLPEM